MPQDWETADCMSWADLPDACLARVYEKLDAKSLFNTQLINKRSRLIASSDIVWREPFRGEFYYHYKELCKKGATSWRDLYRQRRLRESSWATGVCPSLKVPLKAHSGPVFAVTFLSDPFPEGFALSGGSTGENEGTEVFLWDLSCSREGTDRRPWPLLGGELEDNLGGVFHFRQLPGTQQLVCSGFGQEVNVYTLVPRQQDACIEERGDSSSYLPASPLPWRLQHTHTMTGHEGPVPFITVQGEGRVATASFDGAVRLWSIPAAPPDDQQDEEGDGERTGAMYVASQQAQHAPSAAGHCFPRAGTAPAQLSATCVLRDLDSPADNLLFHNNAVVGVAISADCRTACSGGNDMQVKQWDVERGKVTQRVVGHEGWIWHVEAEDERNNVLLTGSTDSSVRVWDMRAGRQVQHAAISSGPLYPIAGLCLRPPDQRYVLCGVFDGGVHVIDRRQMQVLYSLKGHSDRATRVACSGDTVLSVGFDGLVNLWSFAAEEERRR